MIELSIGLVNEAQITIIERPLVTKNIVLSLLSGRCIEITEEDYETIKGMYGIPKEIPTITKLDNGYILKANMPFKFYGIEPEVEKVPVEVKIKQDEKVPFSGHYKTRGGKIAQNVTKDEAPKTINHIYNGVVEAELVYFDKDGQAYTCDSLGNRRLIDFDLAEGIRPGEGL